MKLLALVAWLPMGGCSLDAPQNFEFEMVEHAPALSRIGEEFSLLWHIDGSNNGNSHLSGLQHCQGAQVELCGMSDSDAEEEISAPPPIFQGGYFRQYITLDSPGDHTLVVWSEYAGPRSVLGYYTIEIQAPDR